ncbi:hypothetical protein TNCV_2858321 [Trichonephila clavipes]|nr:hypothetical protein TNCV_2858321 [Trichonephila clavipes]
MDRDYLNPLQDREITYLKIALKRQSRAKSLLKAHFRSQIKAILQQLFSSTPIGSPPLKSRPPLQPKLQHKEHPEQDRGLKLLAQSRAALNHSQKLISVLKSKPLLQQLISSTPIGSPPLKSRPPLNQSYNTRNISEQDRGLKICWRSLGTSLHKNHRQNHRRRRTHTRKGLAGDFLAEVLFIVLLIALQRAAYRIIKEMMPLHFTNRARAKSLPKAHFRSQIKALLQQLISSTPIGSPPLKSRPSSPTKATTQGTSPNKIEG